MHHCVPLTAVKTIQISGPAVNFNIPSTQFPIDLHRDTRMLHPQVYYRISTVKIGVEL